MQRFKYNHRRTIAGGRRERGRMGNKENSWERCNTQGGGLLDESLDFLNSSVTTSTHTATLSSSEATLPSTTAPLPKRLATRPKKRPAEETRQDEGIKHVCPNLHDSRIQDTDLVRSVSAAPPGCSVVAKHFNLAQVQTTGTGDCLLSVQSPARELAFPSLLTLPASCHSIDTGCFPNIPFSNTPTSVLNGAIAVPGYFSRLHMEEGILCNVPPVTQSSGHLMLHPINSTNFKVGSTSGGAASTFEEPRALSTSSSHRPFEHARGDEPDTESRGAYKLLNASGTELHEAERVGIYPRRKVTDTHSPRIRNQAPLVVSLDSIKPLFDRPLSDAAKTLGISVTSLKAVCRRLGLERW